MPELVLMVPKEFAAWPGFSNLALGSLPRCIEAIPSLQAKGLVTVRASIDVVPHPRPSILATPPGLIDRPNVRTPRVLTMMATAVTVELAHACYIVYAGNDFDIASYAALRPSERLEGMGFWRARRYADPSQLRTMELMLKEYLLYLEEEPEVAGSHQLTPNLPELRWLTERAQQLLESLPS
jgi:hypothetical protein